MGGLAGKLDLQIGMNRGRSGSCLGQPSADGDHGKLRAAGYLKHVQVAVAVPGIKRFDGHGDQEIALPGVADALASRRMAYTLALMQRVRDMIGEGGLFQSPLAIRGKRRKRQKQKGQQYSLAHNRLRTCQNLNDTDIRAAPNAPAVTIATGRWAEAMP